MKLQTSILPRRDGTVIVGCASGSKHTFVKNVAGDLVCDVTDEADVAELLRNGNFFPEDEADNVAAISMLESSGVIGGDLDQDLGSPDLDDAGDDPVDPNAPPVEVPTPPKAAKAVTPPKAAKVK